MAKLIPFWKYVAPPVAEAITNGGFEQDQTGWKFLWASIETDIVHSGLKSCGIGYSQGAYQDFATPIQIAKVLNYEAYAYKVEDYSGYNLAFHIHTDVGGTSVYIQNYVPFDSQWHKLNLLSYVLARFPTATTISGLGFHGGSSDFGNYRIDDVSLIYVNE